MGVRKRTWKSASGVQKSAWAVDYKDQAGMRRHETFQRKRDADEAYARIKIDVRKGIHAPESASVTVAKAAELWLDACDAKGLERWTTKAYRSHVKHHIEPFLGRHKLSQLSAPVIRDFEDKLRRGELTPGADQSAPRSATMIRKIVGSLGAILGDAQERGLIVVNVVRDLRSRRRPGKERRADQRQKGRLRVGTNIPSPAEVRAFVGALEGRWRPLLITAVLTGLRSSELRGLRWEDVNFRKCEIHVRQRADERGKLGPLKSATSERSVPFGEELSKILNAWKAHCPKGDLSLVFPNGRGKVESHANIINRGLCPAMVRAGLIAGDRAKYAGLHTLRHFYASYCINRQKDGGLELPPKMVQERLGHSTIVMTMDRYGHLFDRGDDGVQMATAELALLGEGQPTPPCTASQPASGCSRRGTPTTNQSRHIQVAPTQQECSMEAENPGITTLQ